MESLCEQSEQMGVVGILDIVADGLEIVFLAFDYLRECYDVLSADTHR